ncbi:MAG TPA: response regulator transcription factor [Aggregatilineaceae bacterium]|nr:response regulator transcription factor [Aggregatilineaceae bacterium]
MSTPIPHILIVDDDPEIVRLLKAYLEQVNFRVLVAYEGRTALHMIRYERPALLILDLMLPEQTGWDITRIVRSDPTINTLPIIMLTARVEDTDKIIGLELGADDYITKPFNPREVVARVRSVLRRSQPETMAEARTTLRCGNLTMDIARREVTVHGQSVELTPTEFELLRTLLASPGYVFTRAELIEQSLGYEYESMERTLDTHIKNLRRKIELDPKQPEFIQTVYGVGYRLEVQHT